MEPTRETLNAFVDGELPPREMERIAALLGQRPDLEAYVAQQEKLRAQMKQAFDSVVAAPVPPRLVAARVARRSPGAGGCVSCWAAASCCGRWYRRARRWRWGL